MENSSSTSYYYYHHHPNGGSSHPQSSPPPSLHLLFFLLTLLLFIALSCYFNYESELDSIMEQLRLLLIASPLVLLLAVHWLSSGEDGRRTVPFFLSLPEEREAFHRAGGSPAGVGLLLALLLLMVSYQSYFQERWF